MKGILWVSELLKIRYRDLLFSCQIDVFKIPGLFVEIKRLRLQLLILHKIVVIDGLGLPEGERKRMVLVAGLTAERLPRGDPRKVRLVVGAAEEREFGDPWLLLLLLGLFLHFERLEGVPVQRDKVGNFRGEAQRLIHELLVYLFGLKTRWLPLVLRFVLGLGLVEFELHLVPGLLAGVFGLGLVIDPQRLSKDVFEVGLIAEEPLLKSHGHVLLQLLVLSDFLLLERSELGLLFFNLALRLEAAVPLKQKRVLLAQRGHLRMTDTRPSRLLQPIMMRSRRPRGLPRRFSTHSSPFLFCICGC